MRTVWKSNEYEEAFNKLDSVFQLLEAMSARKELSSMELQILSSNIHQVRDAIERSGLIEIE